MDDDTRKVMDEFLEAQTVEDCLLNRRRVEEAAVVGKVNSKAKHATIKRRMILAFVERRRKSAIFLDNSMKACRKQSSSA